MNTTMSSKQIQTILDLAEQKCLTPARTTAILSSGILADVFDSDANLSDREAVRQALKLGALLPESIILVVDYGTEKKLRTLEEMIVAGRYDWKNNDITAKRFQITGVGQLEFEGKLFRFNRDISSDNAERLIKADDPVNPWNLGKIEHLLSFGEKFPEEQRKYPIVGLGSVAEVRGCRRVPYLRRLDSKRDLHRLDSKRDLGLGWRDDDWGALSRFLAVRKKVPSTQS
jgi:hypothetical protein